MRKPTDREQVLLALLEEATAQILYLRRPRNMTAKARSFTQPSTAELLRRIRPHLLDPDLLSDEDARL